MKDLRRLGRRGKKHKSVFTGRVVFLLIAILQGLPLISGKQRSMQLNPTSFRSNAEFFS